MFIILASSSYYRKELLARLGLNFSVCAPCIDESIKQTESAKELVYRLAKAKAYAVAKSQNGLIIASDQVATLVSGKNTGTILTKPHTYENALKQLQQSSGNSVVFFTSLVLLNTYTGNIQIYVANFKVVFKKLTTEQISNYLKKEAPYNCAGSFKSEALGIALCERFEGEDPNSLIGLPLIQLVKMLANEGIDVLTYKSA